MRRLAGITLSIIAIGAFAIVEPRHSTAAEAPQPQAGYSDLEEARRIRGELGLRADPSFVAQTFGDSTQFPNREFNGIPISLAEARDLQKRIEFQQSIAPAREWASRQPGYAGGYTDQVAGGVPVFAFKGDPESIRPRLVSQLAEGSPYRIEPVSRSVEDLLALKADVRAEWDSLERSGVDILNVGIDMMANTVTIGVVGLTPGDEAQLFATFPDGVVVRAQEPAVLDACNSRLDCGNPD
jgi:hypothetical protein